jgi:hypothetical protein
MSCKLLLLRAGFTGFYLYNPAGKCRLAELTNNEGQDGSSCYNNEYLGHDSGPMLEVRWTEARGHTRSSTQRRRSMTATTS